MSIRNFLKRHLGPRNLRRKAWAKHRERLSARRGLYVYPHHLYWTLPGELMELARRWGDLPGIPLDRCQTLLSVARSICVRGVPGDSVECGVRYGKSSFFILHGLNDAQRLHHLCDSFEGLSEPSDVDVDVETIARREGWRAGHLAADEEIVRAKLEEFAQARFHRGWIPDCFSGLEARRFALVHVDVDLYEPTLASFEFFYPRLSPGAVMICDDYGFASCPGARRAVDEFFAHRADAPIELPSGQALIFHS